MGEGEGEGERFRLRTRRWENTAFLEPSSTSSCISLMTSCSVARREQPVRRFACVSRKLFVPIPLEPLDSDRCSLTEILDPQEGERVFQSSSAPPSSLCLLHRAVDHAGDL